MFAPRQFLSGARAYLPLFSFLGLLSSVGAQTHLHDAASFTPDAVLRISAQNISVGGINRYSTLINDSLPAPELRFPEGEVVWIRVYNDMTDQNTTIHWHGLAQAASPFSDGTPLASQWPIPPQHFFDYELQLPNGSAGTYFYHSHVGFQAVTAAGPLIVEDRAEPPYPTDGERTVFVHGLWNETDAQVEQGVNSNPLMWPGETNGIMINGKTISDFGVVDDATVGLAVIEVDPASTYRFRFIGGTALSYTALAFEEHADLGVIEADGHYTQPAPAPEGIVQIGGGQRFSALLETKSCSELRALGKLDFYIQTETRERTYPVTNYAILRYADTCGGGDASAAASFADPLPTDAYPAQKPLDMPPTINGYLDYALRPLASGADSGSGGFPAAAEVTRRVVLNAQVFEDGYYMWRDSNVSWGDSAAGAGASHHTVPYAPYLVGLYLNETGYLPDYDAAVANGGIDPRTQTFPARIGEVLEVVIQNLGADSRTGAAAGLVDVHPFHAHGGHIYDTGSGPGAWSPEVMERQLEGTQPVLRDTTMLFRYNETAAPFEKSGWRAWRLRVTDPGVWMIHCHWLQHMAQGMQTVWVFGDQSDILTVPRPEVEGYLTYGGDVYGNATHDPTPVHFSELAALQKRQQQQQQSKRETMLGRAFPFTA